jgi:hypothetical protein
MILLLCIIPGLQVIMHCICYGKYPSILPIAIYNRETDCIENKCENIKDCNYYSCHLLNVLDKNKIKLVSEMHIKLKHLHNKQFCYYYRNIIV